MQALLAALPHTASDVPVDAAAKWDAVSRGYPTQVEDSYRAGIVARAGQLDGCERLNLLDPIIPGA